MNCCNTNEKSELSNIEKVKGGKSIKMEKRTWLWIVIGLLFIAVLFMTFKAGSTGNVVQAAGDVAKSAVPSSGMVGGC